MRLDRALAIARKELWELRRDPFLLRVVLVLPVAMLLLFGYAVNFWRVLMRSGKGHLRASLHAVSESEEVAKTAPARDYPTKLSRNPQYPSQFFAMSAIMVSYT